MTGKFPGGSSVTQAASALPAVPQHEIALFPTAPTGAVILSQKKSEHVITDATINLPLGFDPAVLPDIADIPTLQQQLLNKAVSSKEHPAVKAGASSTQQQASSAAAVIQEPELPRQQQRQQRVASLDILRQQPNSEVAVKFYSSIPTIKHTSIETTVNLGAAAAGAVTAEKVGYGVPSAPPGPLEFTAAALDDDSDIPVAQGYAVASAWNPTDFEEGNVIGAWRDIDDDAANTKIIADQNLFSPQTGAAGATKDTSVAKSAPARASAAAANLEKTKVATAEAKRQAEAYAYQRETDTLYEKVEQSFTAATTATEAGKQDVAQLYTNAANYYQRAATAKEQRENVLTDFLRDAGNVSFYAAEHLEKPKSPEEKQLNDEITDRLKLAMGSYAEADQATVVFIKNCFYNAGETYFCAAQIPKAKEKDQPVDCYMQAGDAYKRTVDGTHHNATRTNHMPWLRFYRAQSLKNAGDARSRGDTSASNLFVDAANYFQCCTRAF
ncbi:MAG: hypothetical protein WCO92_00385 [Verrucomicrobiota bacterium]